MGDGGVGQHALDVFLDDGHQVAQGHGDRGEDDQGDGKVIAGAVGQDRQAQEQGHRGGLGGGGDEGDDLIGAPLVDVRGPEVEGEHGELEEKPRHSQKEPDDAERGERSRPVHDDALGVPAERRQDAFSVCRGHHSARRVVCRGLECKSHTRCYVSVCAGLCGVL